MKILIFGKNGQVGRRLYEKLLPLGNIIHLGSNDVDFKKPESIAPHIQSIKPNIIINASAYTNVDKSETDQETCFNINTRSVQEIVDAANITNAWFLHYSTDYVFDGEKNGAYTEEDAFNPLGVYGESKAEADQYIIKNSKKFTILRVSSVYDDNGHNFAKTILNLAKTREKLSVIDDQSISPTPASFIADVTGYVLNTLIMSSFDDRYQGVYHTTTNGNISWYTFAKELIDCAEKKGISLSCSSNRIDPIPTTDYPLPAKRPMNCYLDTTKLSNTFNLVIPDWKSYIGWVVNNLIDKGFFER